MIRLGFLIGLCLLSLALIGCDPGRTLRIENHTSESVQVVEDGHPTRIIESGDVLELTTLRFSGATTIQVTTICEPRCSTEVLAEITLTWDDYANDPVLVVGDADAPTPTPDDT